MRSNAAHLPVPCLYAHRGISARFPENTLASFRAARAERCAAIELDVQRTRDGQLAVFHDDDLMRLCSSPARIADLNYAELLGFDVGAWKSPSFAGERIPLLGDVFAAWGASGTINVEIKSVTATDTALARDVAQFLGGRSEKIIVSSFDWELLRLYRTFDAERPLAILFSGDLWAAAIACARELGARAVNPNVAAVSEVEIQNARKLGLDVNVYTVNDPAVAKKLVAAGVTGLFTDDAPLLARQLEPSL